ncbi:MAG: ADP-ribosylglycohydrolase family protein [Planctomycetota bacterium]|nr:ADP-ribosylglycohydrolase family protein [Planctomycetota bacterium]
MSYEDRAAGAIVGAFIGDALGTGCHWYYDLDEMRRHYGPWVKDYVAPRSGHYHDMLKAGQYSQTGEVCFLLLQSLTECKEHDANDFLSRIDSLLSTLDGTAFSGRFTEGYMRDMFAARKLGKDWSDPETPSWADTSEAAMRLPLIAALYGRDRHAAGREMLRNTRLTHQDPLVVAQSTAFGLVIRELISGAPLNPGIAGPARALAKGPNAIANDPRARGLASLPTEDLALIDSILQPAYIISSAQDPKTKLEEPWRASMVYGMACAIHFLIPAAYYIAGSFPGQFEEPVLHAVNGGGNNMARACLTGALAGAQVGLSQIPKRFIDGLENSEDIVKMSKMIASGF